MKKLNLLALKISIGLLSAVFAFSCSQVRHESRLPTSTLAKTQVATGTSDGGGGNAFVCRDKSTKKITSAELLDLYEGHAEFDYSYSVSSKEDTVEAYLNKAVAKFKDTVDTNQYPIMTIPYFYWEDATAWSFISIPNYLIHFDEKFKILPDGVGLEALDDSNGVVIPKVDASCSESSVGSIERLAFYKESIGKILLDSEIWSHLNNLNRAALIFHEASYYYRRNQGFQQESNSKVTRKIVSQSFADQKIPALYENVSDKKISCRISGLNHDIAGKDIDWTEVVYSQDESGDHYFNFASFLGRAVYSQTSIKFKSIKDSSFGNAEIIASDISLPPMRLINDSDFKTPDRVILWILANNQYPDLRLPITDVNGDMNCRKLNPSTQSFEEIKIHLNRKGF